MNSSKTITDGNVVDELLRYTIFDTALPLGVYAISAAGDLILCNPRARSILKLGEGKLEHSIRDFCLDQDQTEQLDETLRAAERENRWIENHLLSLRVENREVIVRQSVLVIRDAASGQSRAYLCCMTDVTEDQRYRRTFDDLPVGIYQLDEHDRVIEANPRLAAILGYDSPSEIEGRAVKDLYADPERSDSFRERVKSASGMVDHRVELRRKDGKLAVASVFARQVTSADGRYLGRAGAMIDVTDEEQYKRLREELPLGLYEVRINANGEDVFFDCNQQFAALLEYDDEEDLKGRMVKDIYATEAEYEKLKREIQQRVETDKPLHGFRLNVRGKKGKDMVLEVTARVRRDREGNMIGRVGAVRDVTEEAELSKRVAELTHDIGAVLHTQSSSLVNVRQSASVIISTLGPDPFEDTNGTNPEQMIDYLTGPATQFADSLARLIEAMKSSEHTSVLPEENRVALSNQLDLLRNHEELIQNPMTRLSIFRESALLVLSTCSEIHPEILTKEPLRQIELDGRELLRICNLITLHQVKDLTLELDLPLRSLRAYVLSGKRYDESKNDCIVRDLLSKTTSELHEFARSRGIEFSVKHDEPDYHVNIGTTDVLRALSNLLHNAIKYTWKRPDGKAWISIRAREVQSWVHIEFENYGVPIPKDEIDRGLIFQSGFRGRISSDRKRTGTGFGLFDASQVAKKEGGSLSIKSHPASAGRREDDYKQPFLTTVTLILPLQSRGEQDEEDQGSMD